MIRCAAVKDDASGICFKEEMSSSAIMALILAIVCVSGDLLESERVKSERGG